MPILKKKTITPAEQFKRNREKLGYKRINGKLAKPGTKKFNEDIAFIKSERKTITDFYTKRLENTKSAEEQKILANELLNKEVQLNRKLKTKRNKRMTALYDAEKIRISALKERQIKEWSKIINSKLVELNPKMSVKSLVNRLVEKMYKEYPENKKPNIKVFKKNIEEAFYVEFRENIIPMIPNDLKNMSARAAYDKIVRICELTKIRLKNN